MKSFPTRVTQRARHIKLHVKKKQTSIELVNNIMNYYWKESWMKGKKEITAVDRVIKTGTAHLRTFPWHRCCLVIVIWSFPRLLQLNKIHCKILELLSNQIIILFMLYIIAMGERKKREKIMLQGTRSDVEMLGHEGNKSIYKMVMKLVGYVLA